MACRRVNPVLLFCLLVPVAAAIALAGAGASTTAGAAMAALKDGNQRFVAGTPAHPRTDAARRAATFAGGQHPFAMVLSCSDSRVPAEILFDQGIGDLFVIRVAGNVADTDEIGTAEYGAGHLGIPLLVVLGHTRCGAVTAVVRGERVGGSLPGLVDNIVPAAERARAGKLEGEALIDAAITENVWQAIADVLSRSEEIRHLVAAGKLRVVGALYHLDSGAVEWLGEHPGQPALLAAASAADPKTAH